MWKRDFYSFDQLLVVRLFVVFDVVNIVTMDSNLDPKSQKSLL